MMMLLVAAALAVLASKRSKKIHELYRQQKWMYDHRENRIMCIFQPHVRPLPMNYWKP